MKVYPKYKDSGIKCLGEIPAYWTRTRVGNVAKVIDPQPDHRAPALVENGLPYLGIRDIDGNGNVNVKTARKVGVQAIEKQESQFTVEDGDLVFCKVGTLGMPKLIRKPKIRFALSATLVLVKTENKNMKEYLKYVLDSNYILNQMSEVVTGSTRPALGIQQIRKFSIVVPDGDEIDNIVSYLNHKTAQIDSLIAKKKRLIELLKEERAAIINQAVTKGLTPDAPMKDSGIEWLGEVPEHWNDKKLKYLLLDGLKNGLFKKRDQFGHGTKLINVSDLYSQNYTIDINTLERVNTTTEELKTYGVKIGDIFFVRSSLKLEGIAVCACVDDINEELVFECHIIKISPKENMMNYKYLIYLLNSRNYRDRLISISQTTTMTTISQYNIASIEILYPPKKEQDHIVEHIENKSNRIDNIIHSTDKEIEFLQEYRTTLISEVVTGKIDVREAKV